MAFYLLLKAESLVALAQGIALCYNHPSFFALKGHRS
jgi:hypothetical protein